LKYVIIIPDGGADFALEQLGDRTPFEAAVMPHTQALAMRGRVGTAYTTPPAFEAGSDVCSMSLLGYSPEKYHTGRAPLEAGALGLTPGPSDWIFRLNLVTTGQDDTPDAGRMLDHSAGAITNSEARRLTEALIEHWVRTIPDDARGIKVTPGVSYRNIMIDASGRSYANVKTTPPHAIPGEPWAAHVPKGGAEAQFLQRLMHASIACFANHPVNTARREQGLRPASMAWLWGQGTRPTVPPFIERFGLRGAMITSVDLLAGIASFIGWDRLDVPGLTSYHDTDYAAQGLATIRALQSYDVVCCHVEAPDEASHQADWKTKVASLESIDKLIVGPIVAALEEKYADGWRVLIMPDHYTLCGTRKHDATPVPFLMAGTAVTSFMKHGFTEEEANQSDLCIDPGHELMEYFLHSGLPGGRVSKSSTKPGIKNSQSVGEVTGGKSPDGLF
jgi:2,3-bisphosphoglycerate-independent phosphoglycerate mutase